MYTDTKNLAHQLADMSLTAAVPPSTTSAEKSKRKLCKMWRPLLRLMARKSSKSTTAGSSANIATFHPNNVHLNNSIPAKNSRVPSSSALGTSEEWPITLIEDYASLMRKMSCKEECNHGVWDASTTTSGSTAAECERPCQASAKFATTVISSASIEKTPPSTCAHCVYGRNCQHEQFHHHICDAAQGAGTTTTAATAATTQSTITTTTSSLYLPTFATEATEAPSSPATTMTPLAQHALADLPSIQFVHTDDGTFFWTNTQERIDDDLLTAWLCQGWRQLPVEAAVL